MGIEYLFYELLSQYRDELPDDITSKWQPKQIIDAILECDPTADQDAKLLIGKPGAFDNDEVPADVLVKETKAPNKRLLKKHYHRLGFYLHAPVDLQPPDETKWREDLQKAADVLSDYDSTKILVNFRELIQFSCTCCGREIRRNRNGVEATKEMRCLDPKCGAIYDVEVAGDKWRWRIREAHFDCPNCQASGSISAGDIREGTQTNCRSCGRRLGVRSNFVIELLDVDPEGAEPRAG